MQDTDFLTNFTPEEAARAAIGTARMSVTILIDLRGLLGRARWRQLEACQKAFNSGRIFSDQIRNNLESLLQEIGREIDAGTEHVVRPVCLANTSEGPIMDSQTVPERTSRAETLAAYESQLNAVLEAIYRVHDLVVAEEEVEHLRHFQRQ